MVEDNKGYKRCADKVLENFKGEKISFYQRIKDFFHVFYYFCIIFKNFSSALFSAERIVDSQFLWHNYMI